jgi:hypothetical protein
VARPPPTALIPSVDHTSLFLPSTGRHQCQFVIHAALRITLPSTKKRGSCNYHACPLSWANEQPISGQKKSWLKTFLSRRQTHRKISLRDCKIAPRTQTQRFSCLKSARIFHFLAQRLQEIFLRQRKFVKKKKSNRKRAKFFYFEFGP